MATLRGLLQLGAKSCSRLSSIFRPQGVNFINVFTSSFYARRSRKRKKLLKCPFALLGSECMKAARKLLVKLTLDLVFSLKGYISVAI